LTRIGEEGTRKKEQGKRKKEKIGRGATLRAGFALVPAFSPICERRRRFDGRRFRNFSFCLVHYSLFLFPFLARVRTLLLASTFGIGWEFG
jgi:hypothetical protein